jgi:hypothetical protein
MKPLTLLRFASLAALAAAVSAPAARAQAPGQRPNPRVGYAFPAGAQKGRTVTVVLGGQNLAGASAVYFSVPGVQGKVTDYERPLTQKEVNDAREKVQQLQEKRMAARNTPKGAPSPAAPWTPEDEKMLAELRRKIAARAVRQANPALADVVTLEVVIPPDTPAGDGELRLKTAGGLSNPVVFSIGELPEFTEVPATAAAVPPAGPNRASAPPSARAKPPLAIAVPATVNGQILPGEVDRFRFAARKGQRLTASLRARALIPYLADAVPGWFQATLAIRDLQGRQLAYDDDFNFNPDPVLSCVVPEDGDYVVEIKDAIFRGRDDFVYRLTVGELPFITSIFPLGCAVDRRTAFEVAGWNLPVSTASLDTASRRPGTLLLSVPTAAGPSNRVRVDVGTLPELPEAEPNDRAENARPLPLPVVVNGRIARPGDEDVFRFEGRAGMAIVAEIVARRLESPLDSSLQLSDAAGRQIAWNDDFEDKGAGLVTHQADSMIRATLPADGVYFLRVSDAQGRGGVDFGYRLRVGPPQPDFELRVVPSSVNVRAGASVPLTVYALRRDGFDGPIALALRDAPRGFTLSGARIPENQDSIRLTLAAPPVPQDEPLELELTGTAAIAGLTVVHTAVPADDLMQAFAYHHLVPARELKACVLGRGATIRVVSPTPVQMPVSGTARLQLASPAARLATNLHLELSDPPAGISLASFEPHAEFIDVVLACDPSVKAGLQGNLLLQVSGERSAPAPKGGATKAQRGPLGTVPAIPFRIVPKPAN